MNHLFKRMHYFEGERWQAVAELSGSRIEYTIYVIPYAKPMDSIWHSEGLESQGDAEIKFGTLKEEDILKIIKENKIELAP